MLIALLFGHNLHVMYGYSNFSSFLLDPSDDGLFVTQPASFSQPTLTSSSASREEAEMIGLDKDTKKYILFRMQSKIQCQMVGKVSMA